MNTLSIYHIARTVQQHTCA